LQQNLHEERELVVESDAAREKHAVVVALLDAAVALEAVFGFNGGQPQLALVALVLVELDDDLQADRELHFLVFQQCDLLLHGLGLARLEVQQTLQRGWATARISCKRIK